MNTDLQPIHGNAIKTLEKSRESSFKKLNPWRIDCSTLDGIHLTQDIRYSKYKERFQELTALSGPVLYWIIITSNHSHDEIRAALSNYKIKPNARASSAIRNKIENEASRVLYVGKVKGNFWGRIIQHLGYNKSSQTSGLQLYHWAKELGLKIEINAIQFIPEMADLMGMIELKFAQENHPIIGKHK